MGKKPLLGLAGMFLAGLALTGCESSNPRPAFKGTGAPTTASNGSGMPAGTTNGQYAGRTMPSSTTGSMPGGYQPGTSTTSNGFNMNPAVNQQPSQGYPTSNNFGAGQNMGGAGVTGGSMPSVGQPGVVGASNGGVSGPAIPQRPPNTVIYNDTSFPSSPPLGGASGASSLGSGAPLPTPMPVR